MKVSRREVLVGLAATAPLASVLTSAALASDDDNALLKVSRVIVGRDDLDIGIAKRIEAVLAERIEGFSGKLSSLASAVAKGGERDAILGALGEADLDLALKIAQPWYTGKVGIGDEHGFDDGAVFVTFLGAEAYTAVKDFVPLQTYSTGAPGWWADTPTGVTAPTMPPEILDWAWYPPGATGNVGRANPAILALVTPTDI